VEFGFVYVRRSLSTIEHEGHQVSSQNRTEKCAIRPFFWHLQRFSLYSLTDRLINGFIVRQSRSHERRNRPYVYRSRTYNKAAVRKTLLTVCTTHLHVEPEKTALQAAPVEISREC